MATKLSLCPHAGSEKLIPPIQQLRFETEQLCIDEIAKEGYLQKESAFFRTRRNRFCVLKRQRLYSYHNKTDQKKATEIFDLSLWTHIKSNTANKQFKFILISSKPSHQRTFITHSKFELKSWINHITKIQNKIKKDKLLQFVSVNSDCICRNDCDCILRIKELMHIYTACLSNEYYLSFIDIIHRVFDNKYSIARILDDHIHILYIHSDSLCDICRNLNIDCAMKQCIPIQRNRRNRLRDHEISNKLLFRSDSDTVLTDILDEIHCYLLHTFELGFRLTEREKVALTHSQNGHIQMSQIMKHKRLEHSMDLTTTHSKFVTNTSMTVNEAKEPDQKYSFSYQFNYWMPNKRLYVSQKYIGFKDELLSNPIFNIEITEWNDIQTHSNILLKTKHCKTICANMCEFMKAHNVQIKEGQLLKLENIMAIKLYTDCDELQYEFSKSFRKLDINESMKEIIERHRNYYWFARIMRETVACFGNFCSTSTTYYHGISTQMVFSSTIAKFNPPTSTTESAVVAVRFAKNKGIIIKLCPAYDNIKCFQCKWLSAYASEEETLFIGGHSSLKIVDICDCVQMKSYKVYLHCLNEFIKCLYGMCPNNATGKDIQILDKLFNNIGSIPPYFVKIFKAFARQTKKIKIDIDNIVNGKQSQYFLSVLLTKKRDFINLEQIQKVFVNLQEIELCNYDNIVLNPCYFDTVAEILQKSNAKSLQLIVIKWIKFSLRHRNFFNQTMQTEFVRKTGFRVNLLHQTGLGHQDLMPQYLQIRKV